MLKCVMANFPLGGSAWKVKKRDLTVAFVLAVSAQKKILRSIWTDLAQIRMSIFGVGRNCTGEQSATLLSETSDVRECVFAVHDFSDPSFLKRCAKFDGSLNEVAWYCFDRWFW
jgi:hypothetical protein